MSSSTRALSTLPTGLAEAGEVAASGDGGETVIACSFCSAARAVSALAAHTRPALDSSWMTKLAFHYTKYWCGCPARTCLHPSRSGLGAAAAAVIGPAVVGRSEEHTSELQSRGHLVCRLLLEKKKKTINIPSNRHVSGGGILFET